MASALLTQHFRTILSTATEIYSTFSQSRPELLFPGSAITIRYQQQRQALYALSVQCSQVLAQLAQSFYAASPMGAVTTGFISASSRFKETSTSFLALSGSPECIPNETLYAQLSGLHAACTDLLKLLEQPVVPPAAAPDPSFLSPPSSSPPIASMSFAPSPTTSTPLSPSPIFYSPPASPSASPSSSISPRPTSFSIPSSIFEVDQARNQSFVQPQQLHPQPSPLQTPPPQPQQQQSSQPPSQVSQIEQLLRQVEESILVQTRELYGASETRDINRFVPAAQALLQPIKRLRDTAQKLQLESEENAVTSSLTAFIQTGKSVLSAGTPATPIPDHLATELYNQMRLFTSSVNNLITVVVSKLAPAVSSAPSSVAEVDHLAASVVDTRSEYHLAMATLDEQERKRQQVAKTLASWTTAEPTIQPATPPAEEAKATTPRIKSLSGRTASFHLSTRLSPRKNSAASVQLTSTGKSPSASSLEIGRARSSTTGHALAAPETTFGRVFVPLALVFEKLLGDWRAESAASKERASVGCTYGERELSGAQVGAVVAAQRLVRSHLYGPGRWYRVYAEYRKSAAAKKECKRMHVLKELLSSEHVYATDLAACSAHVIHPLRTAAQSPATCVLSAELIQEIFRNLSDISALTNKFYARLAERWTEFPCNGHFADVLLQLSEEFLSAYAVYVKGYNQSVKALTAADADPALHSYFLEAKKGPASKKVDSYLIMPCQRLPRLEMMFDEVYKLTPAEHVDKDQLARLCQTIKELTEDIDRQTRATNQLVAIAQSIHSIPNIVTLDRWLLREGTVRLPAGKRKFGSFKAFLFSDLFLFVTPLKKISKRRPDEKYEFSRAIPLKSSLRLLSYVDRRPKELGYVTEYSFALHDRDEQIIRVWCENEADRDGYILDVSSYFNIRVQIEELIHTHSVIQSGPRDWTKM